MININEKFKSFFKQELDNVKVVVGESKYLGLLLDKKNFHRIKKTDETFERIIFTDGGNAELFNNNSTAVQKIRIYSCVYKNKKRINFFRENIDAIAYTETINNRILYILETEPKKINLRVDSKDSSIKKGANRAQISTMFDIARRFLEIKRCTELCEKFPNSLIVMDGTLKPNYPNEKEILNGLYKSADKNNCSVCALAKTNNLITNKILPVSYVLDKMAVLDEWFYFPIIKNNNEFHRAEIVIAKLNKFSKFNFRIDIYKNNMNKADKILYSLKELSTDFSFPGYPYGLIDADAYARISNDERNVLRLKFLSRLNEKIRNSENNTTAHNVLNRIIKDNR